jgi:P4 family phage/plasmid primase-like protien
MNIDMVNRLTAEQIANMPEIRIPIALQRPEFRFVKLIMWEKKAFEPGWTRTTNYTHDAEGLKNWLAKGGNYGVSTGIGGLLVVDIDNVGRMEELGILSRMPETYTVRTRSGGLHFYYICNDFDKKRIMYDLVKTESYISNGRKSQGYMHLGEMQWLGQQVVGPSSRYREIGEDSSVRIQSWKEENLTAIKEIGAEEIMKVFAGKVRFSRKLDAPATEEDDIENLEKESKTRAGKIRKTQKSSKIEPIKIGWLDKIKIADIALPNPIVKSDPLGTGEIQGGHPLHGSDNGLNFSVNVKKNIWHCFRDDSGGGPLELVAMMNGLIECGEAGKGCLIKKEGLLKKTIELLSSKYGIDPKDIPYEISEGKANEIKISKVKRIVESIAEYMNVITMSNSEKSLIYTDGVYKEASNLMLKSFFLSLGATTNNIRAECLETLKASTVIDEKEMDNDPFTICVENGLLSINPETWEITLLPHDPNYMNMIKLPVSYVPGSDCPKIKQFIKDLFITNQCPECNRVIDGNTCPTCKTKGIETGYNSVLIVEELFGYLIFKRYFIHKAFLFIGAGRNGKSTLLNLIRNFLGNENVTSIPIHKLGDRFTPSELFGKLANVSGDISSDALKHTERFKEITGEDFLLVERKFQQPFYMVNVAKQIFTGNQAPKTGDGSYGFYSRFIILNFLKRFDFEPGADKSPNPNLLRDLTSPEELSGLLNLALERLKDLVANNKFTGALSVSETSEMFEELSNPEDVIRQFYGDCLVPQPNGYVGTVALDQRFQEWTKIYGYKPIYINVFIKLMKKIYHLRDMRKMIDGRYITVLVGVGMRK